MVGIWGCQSVWPKHNILLHSIQMPWELDFKNCYSWSGSKIGAGFIVLDWGMSWPCLVYKRPAALNMDGCWWNSDRLILINAWWQKPSVQMSRSYFIITPFVECYDTEADDWLVVGKPSWRVIGTQMRGSQNDSYMKPVWGILSTKKFPVNSIKLEIKGFSYDTLEIPKSKHPKTG